MKAALAALLVMVALPVGVPGAGAADGAVELTMSNFRYCRTATCAPTDVGYLRLSSGPVAGTDNPASIVDVPAGGTVRWVYRDTGPGSCDFFGARCPGHNVQFENGTPGGLSEGTARSNKGPTVITARISDEPGTLIRYFCTINGHYQMGMTGILRVVAG